MAHQGKWRREPLYLTCLENEKNYPCSAGIYSLICLREEGTESLAGRGGAIQSIPSLHLTWGDTKRGALVDRFQRNDQSQGLGVFIKPP